MFNADETINKILGKNNNSNSININKLTNSTKKQSKGFGVYGSGQGLGAGFNIGKGIDINPNSVKGPEIMSGRGFESHNIVEKLNKLLDNLPEVKKAEGELKIQLKNGKVVKIQLHYNEDINMSRNNFGGI